MSVTDGPVPVTSVAGPTALQHLSAAEREVACLLGLSATEGVGAVTVLACHLDGGAEHAWKCLLSGDVGLSRALSSTLRPRWRDRAIRSARSLDPLDDLARCRSLGIEVLVHGRPGYPERLADDPAPPALLFASGPLPARNSPTVAIVGTRNATALGRSFARRLGADLTEAGVSVVSGLAVGIDGAAHRGALDALAASRGDAAVPPGRPLGVIASGLDVSYPARHAQLHREITEWGVLVSENPPGQRPSEWRFPARNRIIAGLSDAVVVVESRSTGGSMITADEAAERGVPVLAVPGHPTMASAAGTNSLICDGVRPVRDARDVLDEIGCCAVAGLVEAARGSEAPRLPVFEQAIFESLLAGPLSLSELVERTGTGLDEVAEALTRLESAGRVASTGGWFEATSSQQDR